MVPKLPVSLHSTKNCQKLRKTSTSPGFIGGVGQNDDRSQGNTLLQRVALGSPLMSIQTSGKFWQS